MDRRRSVRESPPPSTTLENVAATSNCRAEGAHPQRQPTSATRGGIGSPPVCNTISRTSATSTTPQHIGCHPLKRRTSENQELNERRERGKLVDDAGIFHDFPPMSAPPTCNGATILQATKKENKIKPVFFFFERQKERKKVLKCHFLFSCTSQ